MKNKMDLTSGPITVNIYRFALPLAATSVLQQLFNAADLSIVGHFAGTNSMAAVGTNASLIALLVNLFVGISLGANIVIAQAIGSKRLEDVKKAVHTSVLLALIGGVFLFLCGEAFSATIMSLMNVPEDVFPLALLYFRVYLTGMPVILLYNFEAAIFRASGDTKTPLVALTIAGALNVLLNLFFVVVLRMTVNGVALATVLSNVISSAILFVKLLHSKQEIRLKFRELRIHVDIMKRILYIGLPSGIQSCMFNFANIIIQTAINSLGSVIMAASSAGYNLEVLAYYVMNSFSQTCATFIGQNMGAGNMDRCRSILKCLFVHTYICTGAVCIAIFGFSGFLLKLFSPVPEVIHYGQIRLAFIFGAYLFSVWMELGSGYLRGFGLSIFPAIISVAGICGVRILWISTVFRMMPSFQSIMVIYPISLFITGTAIMISVFVLKPSRKGRR